MLVGLQFFNMATVKKRGVGGVAVRSHTVHRMRRPGTEESLPATRKSRSASESGLPTSTTARWVSCHGSFGTNVFIIGAQSEQIDHCRVQRKKQNMIIILEIPAPR